jgi:spore germination protein YaaH
MNNRFLLLPLCLFVSPAAAAPVALAYYTGPESNTSLKAEAGVLGIVAADRFSLAADGSLSGNLPPILFKLAAKHKIGVLATVSNYAAHGFNAGIATAILTPGAAQNAALSNIAKLAAHGYAGINLDFEAVPHKLRPQYTAFAQLLANTLHPAGQVVVLSVPAKTADDPNDSWAGAYDFAALGQIVDTLQVMTYDENGPWGPPGPVAGLDWVSACVGYAESVVPAAKVSMGMPAYGYDWNLTKGGGATVNWTDIPALIAKTGAVPQWDAGSSSPWFSYTADNGASHVVWYENAQSISLKAALAEQVAAASVSVWALGLDDPSYWQAVFNGFGGGDSVPH